MAFLTQSSDGVARFSKIDQDPFLTEDGIPLCLSPVTEEWMLEQTAALLGKSLATLALQHRHAQRYHGFGSRPLQ